MKKKPLIIVCICVVLIAVIGVIVFLSLTKDVKNDTPSASIEGTWQIISHNTDPTNPDSPFVLVEKQYLVIGETSVSYYVDGNLVLSGDYKYENSKLKLSNTETSIENFPEEFVVEQIANSSNYIKLIDEVAIRDWQLIRNAGDGITPTYVDKDSIGGTWDVVVHGTNPVTDEQIDFDVANKTMTDHRSSGDISVEYNWIGDDRVEFTGFGELVICNVSDDCFVMIQLEDKGNVWELHRAK